ncbi:hypothetical protein DDP54_05925 [Cellulomonas sp. WB94]|uniref:SDR family oxidoreductase n=1 Tax=Cellulomonas sp. WB94 TaxID=2173174 RepID=UPI000D57E014|nr:NAD(P)H-binding protein [Cellulomonas sp. WB94]PVU82615.1 hypothetical protein DDP54_05925 [Cellulomonas sp. WB94]
MTTILVTGGTGRLGRDTVPVLRARGADVRVLSRQPSTAPDRRTGDLATGAGLNAALAGVDTVVHLAAGRDQPGETRHLVDAAAGAGVAHLVFISIIGIDEIPLAYYREKLAAERLITAGEVAWTVFRTTQFHQLVAGLFAAQRWSPLLLAPAISIQPIDTRAVGAHLADLALDRPQGRAPELGGPEVLDGRRLAELYRANRGGHRPIVRLSMPGRTFAGYAAGHHLAPGSRAGGRTFEAFLADETVAGR